ncbi:class I SAM-dependent methyltransferase [Streptomyces sp. NPDC101115]|uniref:class I SAM-dependent methyltransferase n=1 Tax=Streptomyces sp. NPDC101115 TaxID=3366106 RepID=UPI0037FC2500
MSDRNTAEYWDPIYDDGRDWRQVCDAEIAMFTRYAAPQPGQRALDIGCGTGQLARCLHSLGYDVTGVEVSASALLKARTRSYTQGPRWVQHDIQTGPPPGVPSASVDVVSFRLSFQFLDRKAQILDMARGLLRPGGLVYLVLPVLERESLPAGRRSSALPAAEITDLCKGWRADRWELGWLDHLILRSP